MAIIPELEAQDDGWTDWIWPVMTGYRMVCCDCGLAHDLQFEAHKVVERREDGSFEAEPLDIKEYRVALRVSRNNRSTAQVRRHKKAG